MNIIVWYFLCLGILKDNCIIMYFNTKWDVDQHKTKFENAEHWKFRRAFLIANQNKYPEDRLETLSRMFIFIEFMECK